MDRNIRQAGSALATLAIMVLIGAQALGAPKYSDWATPTWLGDVVNSTAEDAGPAISKNGLALYFYSTRAGGQGGEDIYVSYRSSLDGAWGAPLALAATINTAALERVPAFSRDGHWMFFARGAANALDIWVSYRLHTDEDFGDFGWQAAQPVSSLNTAFGEAGPSFFQDDEVAATYLFFNSTRPGGLGAQDIYVATRQPDGSFAGISNVRELNSPFIDARSSVRHDGLEIVFLSNRQTGSVQGQLDLWHSTRDSTTAPWSTPTPLVTLNTSANDYTPYLSADGGEIYFASERAGGLGLGDLYMSTRGKVHP